MRERRRRVIKAGFFRREGGRRHEELQRRRGEIDPLQKTGREQDLPNSVGCCPTRDRVDGSGVDRTSETGPVTNSASPHCMPLKWAATLLLRISLAVTRVSYTAYGTSSLHLPFLRRKLLSLIIPCQNPWLIAFPSHFVLHGPPVDRLSQAIHTTRSHDCSEFICVTFDHKVPTSSKFGLCFLFGSGRTSARGHHPFYPGVGDSDSPSHTFSHSQTLPPSSTLQDNGSTPPPHLLPDPKVVNNDSPARRANATLLVLARNSDLNGVIQSIEQVESKFNRKFNYPWVLLNEVEFSSEFKRWVDGGLRVVVY